MANDKTLELRLVAKDMMSAVVEGAQKSMRGLADAVKDSALSAAGAWPKFSASFTTTIDDVVSGVGVAKDVLGKLQQAWDFAKEGAENERIANSFQATADSVGVSADAMLVALDKAAMGTVDDEIAMQVASRNMALGMATDLQSNVALMELARSASIKFGGTTEDAFEGVSTAIANLQTRQLKQYGIIVDTKEANETYAKALGKTADQLTEAEQRTALLNDVMLKSKDIFKDVEAQTLTTTEKFKKFETQMGNIIDVAKATAVDAFTPYLDGLSFLETLTDSNATETDKLRAAYESLRSRGIDPNSQAMALLKQKIEAADAATKAIAMTTSEQAVRANMAHVGSLKEVSNAYGTTTAAVNGYYDQMALRIQADQNFKMATDALIISTQELTKAEFARIATEGMSPDAALRVMTAMGMIDKATATRIEAERKLKEEYLRTGDLDTYIRKLHELGAEIGLLPDYKAITIELQTQTGGIAGRVGGEISDDIPSAGSKNYPKKPQPKAGGREAMASGGNVFSGRSYWVGEQGAEPFIPAVDGRILSRQDAMSALKGGGGGGNVINVALQANVASQVDVDEMAYRVSEVIGRRLQAYA
jgi:hypothetical protein